VQRTWYEMVSVAEEQSATVLSLQEGYLFPIYVAVLARTLIASCFHMRFYVYIYSKPTRMRSADAVGSTSRVSHPRIPVETQLNDCHLLSSEEP